MNQSIFKQTVKVEKNVITIKINCNLREHVKVPKRVYRANKIYNLIPEEFKSKVKLIEQPEKAVSNINKPEFSTSGVWVFEIIQEKTQPTQKPKTTRAQTRRRRKTVNKK